MQLPCAPNGVLFYSRYNGNQAVQVKPGSTADDKVDGLGAAPLSIAPSVTGLNFVPTGLNGAGRLKMVSYPSGRFYDVTYSADGSGTYNLDTAAQTRNFGFTVEGFAYIAGGSPVFTAGQKILINRFNGQEVVAYDTDSEGNPETGTGVNVATGITTGLAGAAIDPVTGDYLFTAGTEVFQIQGFKSFGLLGCSDWTSGVPSGITHGVNAVIWAGNKWVAVGATAGSGTKGQIYTSLNGTGWTA